MSRLTKLSLALCGCAALAGAAILYSHRALALSTASGDGIIVYGESGNTTPQWRTYTNASNSFGSETATVAGATGLAFVVRTSPTKQEAIAGYVNSGGTLQVMCYDGASWSNEWSVSVGGTGTTRRFDIAYETNSGDVMVLYSTNAGTTNELAYRTKPGSAGCGSANWAGATNLNPARTSGVVHWVKMAWDKRSSSNLITALWADASSDLSAMVWSGSVWGNEPAAATELSLEVVAAAQDVDDFDVEYESSSGDIMVVWAHSSGGNGTNGGRYRTCTGGTSGCAWNATTSMPTFIDDATNLDISANPDTDEIVFASIGNAGSDLQAGYWSGSAWTNTANLDATSGAPLAGTRLVATGWLVAGGTTRSIIAYNDSGTTNVGWYAGNGGTFAAQTDFSQSPAFGNPQKWYDVQTDPLNKDNLMFTLSDAGADLFAKRLVMGGVGPSFTWTNADGSAALEASLAQATVSDFGFAHWRFIPAPSDSITFSISDTSVGFGTLSPSASRYAAGDGSGSASQVQAHTLTASADSADGYALSVRGATLASGANTITPLGDPGADPSAGAEQFGIRMVVNSGSGTVSAPYNHATKFAYGAGGTNADEIATGAGDGSSTEFSVRYAGNIAGTTEPGAYAAALTYIATATF